MVRCHADEYGHPHIERPSFALTKPSLPLLPTRSRRLPCVARPTDYDEDAGVRTRRAAAKRCREECPALTQCTMLAAQLADAGAIPRGVLAGNYEIAGRWRRA